MNRYQPIHTAAYRKASYIVKQGEIIPVEESTTVGYSFEWLPISFNLRKLCSQEGGPVGERSNTESAYSIHLDFASCRNEAALLTWVHKYGLPYDGTGFEWWKDQEGREIELKGISVDELLSTAAAVEWIIEATRCIAQKAPVPPWGEGIESLYLRMGLEGLPEWGHRLSDAPEEKKFLYQIINAAISCVSPYLSFRNEFATPFWGFSYHNLMQYVFMGLLSDLTSDDNLNTKCDCGRWFSAKRKSARYCSEACRNWIKQRNRRKTEGDAELAAENPLEEGKRRGRPSSRINT